MTELLITVGLIVLVVFMLSSLPTDVMLLIHKPGNWLLRKIGLQQDPEVSSDINNPLVALKGKRAVVVNAFKNGRGRVKAGSTEWLAESSLPSKEYSVGETVFVTGSKSNVLIVSSNEN